MPISQLYSQDTYLYACLPFVELEQETLISLGPVVFWPASRCREFLGDSLGGNFEAYLQGIGQIRARSGTQHIETGKLNLKQITCISLAQEVPREARDFLLLDSLYLLYFACTFRSLYYGQKIPSFHAFRKIIPANEEFFEKQHLWQNLFVREVDREESICLHLIDIEMCQSLGKALASIYLLSNTQNFETIHAYKRLVRSIRYLVDRFFERFINLLGQGLSFSQELFEPEDVLLLASSFESLFNLDEKQTMAADFKHKLRPLLHLKYSRPVEIFWKWVDDFYAVKRRVLQGEHFFDPLFRLNPNFEISHLLLGMKLFVYSVYYYLFQYQLIQSTHVDPYTPPDFKWIHPEEILLFFWTETSVLEKISLFIKQGLQESLKDESLADLNLLTTLFVSLYDRYYLSEEFIEEGFVRFLPTPLADLQQEGNDILEGLKKMQLEGSKQELLQCIHPYFIFALEDRLQERKIIRRTIPK